MELTTVADVAQHFSQDPKTKQAVQDLVEASQRVLACLKYRLENQLSEQEVARALGVPVDDLERLEAGQDYDNVYLLKLYEDWCAQSAMQIGLRGLLVLLQDINNVVCTGTLLDKRVRVDLSISLVDRIQHALTDLSHQIYGV